MENIKTKKPWIKEALYSWVALIVMIPLGLLVDHMDKSQWYLGEFARRIDWFFLWNLCSHIQLYEVADYLIFTMFLVLIGLSIYWGVRSLRKTTPGSHRGRILGIISTTIAMFIVGMFLVSFVVDYDRTERSPKIKVMFCKKHHDPNWLSENNTPS